MGLENYRPKTPQEQAKQREGYSKEQWRFIAKLTHPTLYIIVGQARTHLDKPELRESYVRQTLQYQFKDNQELQAARSVTIGAMLCNLPDTAWETFLEAYHATEIHVFDQPRPTRPRRNTPSV